MSTRNTLRQNAFAVAELEQSERGVPVGQQLEAVREGDTLLKKWEILLERHATQWGVEHGNIAREFCQDGYGTPMNMAYRTNLPSGANQVLRQEEGRGNADVVFWSSGRNAVNEFGNGDDIVEGPRGGRRR